MANHRPKSLSELNNVYDKAMRAERAIKESSTLLSTPETTPAPPSENIFEQLETKAAEAQKNQVFDPDITNIANDFLKRYAQPEKPKAAPKEIKRPAPSIQVYHTPVKETKPEAPAEAPVAVRPQSTPVHKPASDIPPTESVMSKAVTPEVKEQTEFSAPEAPAVIPAPIVKAPAAPKPEALVKAEAPVRVDHTPRPAARVRITSTERNELMEEYLRVMSDEDDEPSIRKPKFSFFKKRKKYDEEPDLETAEELYEELDDSYEDSAEEEIPVVPFDNSDVQYEDEYSNSPEDGFITDDDEIPHEPMNLYDYIEADFDYSEDEEVAEEAQEITEEVTDEPSEEIQEEIIDEPSEEASEEFSEDIVPEAEEIAVEVPEIIPQEVSEEPEAAVYPEEITEDVSDENTEAEEIVPAEEEIFPVEEEIVMPEEEEAEEVVYPEAPTAGMVFEDIFSVSDESKRSHTGGNWNEVFGEQSADTEAEEVEEIIPTEETDETYAAYNEAENEKSEAFEEAIPLEEAAAIPEEPEEDYAEDDLQEEIAEPVKKNLAAKIIMILAIVLCFAVAGVSIFSSAVLGVDKGKIFSDNLRAFSATETVADLGINKGDLVITENIFAAENQLYVYAHETNGEYRIGKVTAVTTNLLGDYLYVSETSDGVKLINRDTSMGVVTATYPGIGSVLSVICDYGVFIAIACLVFAIALIICLVIIIRKQRRYEAAAAIYDNPDNFRDDDDDSTPDGDSNSDEYYSDYDTDGIEQGLFVEL